jgi:hypothetical protein
MTGICRRVQALQSQKITSIDGKLAGVLEKLTGKSGLINTMLQKLEGVSGKANTTDLSAFEDKLVRRLNTCSNSLDG